MDRSRSPKLRMLWTLFSSMFLLSSCAFGGGFVVVSLIKKKFVEDLGLLDEDEMLDVTAITQSAPGPILVNCAVIIGYRLAGTAGSFAAALGTLIPPMLIISVISVFYDKFRENRYIAAAMQVMRAGVAAVIFDAVISLAKNVLKTKRALYIIMMTAAFICTYFFGMSAMLIIIICLAVGISDMIISRKKEGR